MLKNKSREIRTKTGVGAVSAVLSVLLCLLMLCLVSCQREETEQSLSFTSNGDGTCTVSGIGSVTASEIVIPEVSPEGDMVTAIGNYAFMMAEVEKVVIPETVTSIGIAAFYDCADLKAVEIPDSVRTIGYNAFYCCGALEEIRLPQGLTSIAADTFYGCHSLERVILPDGVTEIGEFAFFGCTALKEMYGASCTAAETEGWMILPEGLTRIGKSAFYGCHALRAVQLSATVEEIGSDAFYQCDGIEGVYIQDLAAYCGTVFYNMTANPLFYGESLYIGGQLVTVLIIPQGVATIKDYAFTHAASVVRVAIPLSVTAIGDGAFHGCHALDDVYYEGSSSEWDDISVGKLNADFEDAPVQYAKND